MNDWYVERFDLNGNFVACISGMGRNRGTWNCSHSKRTAQRYARQLNAEYPEYLHKAESMYY